MNAAPVLPDVPTAAARIRTRDPLLRAFLHTRLDAALADHERRSREPPRSPLHGMPYALKDMWDTAGIPTTAGSYRYRDRVPSRSAPVHDVFDEAGGVLMGKTSLSDLAFMPEASNYLIGSTCNPHDATRTSGGSSGGAAAAVADGMIAFDWGSDFGGSIRQPAAYCGVYGMRLSTEAWPVEGMFPMLPPSLAWMNGQGPITGSLRLMRDVIDVAAPRLRTGRVQPFSPRGAIAYLPDRASSGEWPKFAHDVLPVIRRALGEVRTDHDLPSPNRASVLGPAIVASHLDDLLEADKSLTMAEGVRAVASALLLRGRTGDRRFHPHTAAIFGLVALGRYTVFRDRRRAVDNAARFRDAVRRAWDAGRLLVMPTTTCPAPRHGETFRNRHILTFTMIGNVCDATMLAIPFGRFADGLPRSIQLWGPPGSEHALLDAAEKIESAMGR